MSIKRAFAVPADNFTIVSNEWLRDGQISLKARGLLALLASHRIGWEVTIDALVRENPEGRDAIRGAVAELEEAGYLVRDMRVGGGGKFAGVDYSLVDPRISRVGKPDVGLSDVGEPATKKTISSEDHLSEDHAPASRKQRARRIPDTWEPNDTHQAKANEKNLDLAHEAETFRNHAQAHDRRLVDWDAGFRNWLTKAKPRPPQGRRNDSWMNLSSSAL